MADVTATPAPAPAVDAFIKSLVAPTASPTQNFMLVGPSGSGKTEQAVRLHKGGRRVLYVSAGDRLGPVSFEQGMAIKAINDYAFPASAAEVAVKSDLYECIRYMREPGRQHDVIFVDSFMKWCAGNLNYLQFGRGLTGFDLYGTYARQTLAAVNKLKELTNPAFTPNPCHVVVTWGCEVGTDWEGKRSFQPLVDGKQVGPRLPYEFDNVFWMFKEADAAGKVQWVLHTVGSPMFDAKINMPSDATAVAPKLVNPDLHNLITTMEEYAAKKR